MTEHRVVILGGTGFVGSRLAPRLLAAGASVTLAARRRPTLLAGGTEFARCDLGTGEGLEAALEGAEVAYFLVHGMAEGPGFAERERTAVKHFLQAAERSRPAQVIYLGGLYTEGTLSEHLASRRDVGRRLIEGIGALTVRAGVIVGAGSASFEILRGLSARLPLMLAPRWLRSHCQPIGIHDAVEALVRARDVAGAREVDLVGPEVLTYRAMLEVTGEEVRGHKPLMVPVPLLSPALSAHWLRFVTRVDMNVARSLVDSLRHDLVATRPKLAEETGVATADFRTTVRRALAEEARRPEAG